MVTSHSVGCFALACVCVCLCMGIGMHMYVWRWYVCLCGNTCMLRPQEDTRCLSLSFTTLIFRERPLTGCAYRPVVFWGCRHAHSDAWLCMCILGTGIQMFVLGWHLFLTTETSLLTLVLNLHIILWRAKYLDLLKSPALKWLIGYLLPSNSLIPSLSPFIILHANLPRTQKKMDDQLSTLKF